MSDSERAKMEAGEWYTCLDPELGCVARRRPAMRFSNTTRCRRTGARDIGPALRPLLRAAGMAPHRGAVPLRLRPQHRAWPGRILNAGCTILDTAPVRIGDGTLLGPNVQIYCAEHHKDAVKRAAGLEIARPVHIGDNALDRRRRDHSGRRAARKRCDRRRGRGGHARRRQQAALLPATRRGRSRAKLWSEDEAVTPKRPSPRQNPPEQAFDLALLVEEDLLRGRRLGQAGHGHDLAADDDDEAGAGRQPDLADRHGVAGRRARAGWGSVEKEYWVLAMQTGSLP